jgi:hypothetical protein
MGLRLFRLIFAGALSVALGVAGCSTGDPQGGEGTGGSSGQAGATGVAGSPGAGGSTGVAGSGNGGSTGVAGSGYGGSTGVAGSGHGGSTGVAGSGRGGSTGVAGGGQGGSATAGRGGTQGGAGGRGGGSPVGSGGSAGSGSAGRGGGTAGSGTGGGSALPLFSFFVTSLQGMKDLSGNENGFGGDLRYGETGDGAGLRGADKICAALAEKSMPGASAKQWRAFLSTVAGPVNAMDRIGNGPWYDRMGLKVGTTLDDLVINTTTGTNAGRPAMAETAIRDDLPNEYGIPNHTDGKPGCTGNACPDNHDVLTGTGPKGMLYMSNMAYTCNDWTSKDAVQGMGPWVGHSWPRQGSGTNWMSALREGGCAPGVNLTENGGPMPGVYTVGTGGGYGGIYCFALVP